MAKKNYSSKDYALLLEWGLKNYMPTEFDTDLEEEYSRIFLHGEAVKRNETAYVYVGGEGQISFSIELLVQYDKEDAIKVFEVLNELNRRAGVALYIRDTAVEDVFYLCARQELYMDHLTLAAAKRTASRVVLATYDWKNALAMLADRLPEYFSEEAIEIAQQEGNEKLSEWLAAEQKRQLINEEEMMEYMDLLTDLDEWDDEEELPF